jgi:hypothetical protein
MVGQGMVGQVSRLPKREEVKRYNNTTLAKLLPQSKNNIF